MATLKKLMTLLSKEGLVENRAEVIHTFTRGRTSSARDLSENEIELLCQFFESNSHETLDKKRKRLIAAIFGVFKKMNRNVSIEYVKSTACKAAKEADFNNIPGYRLDSLYNAFLKAQKDLTFTGRIVENFIAESQFYN